LTLTRYYYLKDHLGDIRATLTTSGAVDSYEDFYPYGQLMDGRSQTGSADPRYKFLTKERDAETGFDWLDARGYDSRIGKFLSVDPFADEYADQSPYCYALDNPICYLDPSGDTTIVPPDKPPGGMVPYHDPNGVGQDNTQTREPAKLVLSSMWAPSFTQGQPQGLLEYTPSTDPAGYLHWTYNAISTLYGAFDGLGRAYEKGKIIPRGYGKGSVKVAKQYAKLFKGAGYVATGLGAGLLAIDLYHDFSQGNKEQACRDIGGYALGMGGSAGGALVVGLATENPLAIFGGALGGGILGTWIGDELGGFAYKEIAK
jgi:RHS repeat-associated protein